MKLLAWALFIVALATSCCALIVPEDCNDAKIEKDAGVALNLINKHRKEGYVFALFRVADAHVQHLKNASIAYLTLDVLETQCPVISRKHWSSCEHRPFLSITDLGQCKAVVYINELSKRKLLYAYNCTVSPVPPKIYECKHCFLRITVLEDTEKYTEEANKILEKYRLGSNESNYFKVEKVQKVFSAMADRTVLIVEFIIKETRCPRNIDATSVSQCEFLPDGKANLGFCIGKTVKGAPDMVEVDSCVIYDTQNLSICHHHHHFHHDLGEGRHHCNVTGHGCKHPLHKHHHSHHHHHDPHHHFHLHHHHLHHHLHHHHHHPHHNHSHHHGHRHEYRDPQILGPGGPRGNHKSEQTQEEHPGIPPPPGPQYPPPPPGGPHHFPPSKYPPPPPGPPPPQPFPHRPDDHHRRPYGRFPKFDHGCHHCHHRCNDTVCKREESGSSEEHDSFSHHLSSHRSSADFVHHVPILSEHGVLQAPDANFLDHPLPDQGRHGKHIIQPFPEVSSGSKSCPGKPKYYLLPALLSLFPIPS